MQVDFDTPTFEALQALRKRIEPKLRPFGQLRDVKEYASKLARHRSTNRRTAARRAE